MLSSFRFECLALSRINCKLKHPCSLVDGYNLLKRIGCECDLSCPCLARVRLDDECVGFLHQSLGLDFLDPVHIRPDIQVEVVGHIELQCISLICNIVVLLCREDQDILLQLGDDKLVNGIHGLDDHCGSTVVGSLVLDADDIEDIVSGLSTF